MAAIRNLLGLADKLRHLVGFNCAVFIAAAATPENLAVPATARWALIKTTVADVWFKGDGTAAIPVADDATGASSLVCRLGEEVIVKCDGVANISFITAGTNVVVSVSFYSGEDTF